MTRRLIVKRPGMSQSAEILARHRRHRQTVAVATGTGGGSGITGSCLNTDAAAPIKVCANDEYTSYTLYGINADSTVVLLVTVSSTSALSDANTAANSKSGNRYQLRGQQDLHRQL